MSYVERACEVMHDAYEAAAVQSGWETQERSRKPWSDVPEANKATMRAAVGALLDWLPTAGGKVDTAPDGCACEEPEPWHDDDCEGCTRSPYQPHRHVVEGHRRSPAPSGEAAT